MSSPNNPHDKLFKATFSEKDVVIDFIKNFLPNPIREKISLSSLKLEPVSYIRPALTEFYSDVVYSTLLGKAEIQICLLFEHKSYVPVYPHLQILRYMVEAWFQMIKQNESLKPIIPVIVYHGEEKWEYKPFNYHFDRLDSALLPYMPSFEYVLTDMSKWSDDQLEKMNLGILRQAILLMKHGRDTSYIYQYFQDLFSSLEPFSQTNQYTNLIISFSVYILTVGGISEETFINLVQDLPTSVNQQVMTTYEQIVNRGIEKGKIEQQNQVIIQGIESGLNIELIAKLSGLSLKEVKERIQNMGLLK